MYIRICWVFSLLLLVESVVHTMWYVMICACFQWSYLKKNACNKVSRTRLNMKFKTLWLSGCHLLGPPHKMGTLPKLSLRCVTIQLAFEPLNLSLECWWFPSIAAVIVVGESLLSSWNLLNMFRSKQAKRWWCSPQFRPGLWPPTTIHWTMQVAASEVSNMFQVLLQNYCR